MSQDVGADFQAKVIRTLESARFDDRGTWPEGPTHVRAAIRRQHRRRVVVASLSATALVTGLIVGGAELRRDAPEPAGGRIATARVADGFKFSSRAQVQRANQRVFDALIQQAGGAANITESQRASGATSHSTTVRNEVSYQVPGAVVLLGEDVTRSRSNGNLDTVTQSSPCELPHPPDVHLSDGSVSQTSWNIDCSRTLLPGGFVMWTYRIQPPKPVVPPPPAYLAEVMAPSDPVAIVVAPDGTSLWLETHANKPSGPRVTSAALTPSQVGALATRLTQAWRGSSTNSG